MSSAHDSPDLESAKAALAVFDTLSAPALLVSVASGTVVAANRYAAQTLEIPLDNLRGASFQEICPGVSLSDLAPVHVAVAGNGGGSADAPGAPGAWTRSDGSQVQVSMQAYSPGPSSDMKIVVATSEIAHDISDHRGEKRDSAMLRSIVENLPAAVTIYAPQPELKLVYANPAALELNGLASTEEVAEWMSSLIGKDESLDDFVSEVMPRALRGERTEYQATARNHRTFNSIRVQRIVFPIFSDTDESIIAIGSISMEVERLAGRVDRAENRLAQQEVLMGAVRGMYGDEKRRADFLQKVQAIAARASVELNPDRMLEYMAKAMRESFDYYLVAVHLVDPGSGELVLRAINGVGDGPLEPGLRQELDGVRTMAGWVVTSGEGLLIEDTGDQRNYVPVKGWEETRSQLIVPITYSNRTIGVLDLHSRRPSFFDDSHRDVANILAGHIAVNVENARLIEQVREQTLQDERNRLARDMHASLVQRLSSIHWQMSALRQKIESKGFKAEDLDTVSLMSSLAQRSLAEARRSVWDLRADEFDNESLKGAIQSLVDRVSRESGLEATFEFELPGSIDVSPVGSVLLRVCQEAINNVVYHSNATSLSVTCGERDSSVVLMIVDNGQGFDPGSIAEPTQDSGYGLSIMRDRAQQAGARLTVTSAAGEGTKIQLVVPVRPADERDGGRGGS